MSSTAVFKYLICGIPIPYLLEIEITNCIAESAFRLMEKKPKTRNP